MIVKSESSRMSRCRRQRCWKRNGGLYDLGIFSKVDVDLQNPDGEEPSKNVLVQVEEAKRWSVGVGGGAEFARIGGNTGDLTSPVGNASFSPRVDAGVYETQPAAGRAHRQFEDTLFRSSAAGFVHL